ncbi:unnamed protein product, partial [Nesidiocoris tenuis]
SGSVSQTWSKIVEKQSSSRHIILKKPNQQTGITLFVFLIPTICLVLFLSTDIMEIVTVPIGIVMPSVDFCPSNELPIRSCLKINDFTCRYVEILQSKYPLLPTLDRLAKKTK